MYRGNGGSYSTECRIFGAESLFLVFLQLNRIVCETERHACESAESWFIKSAPLSSMVTSDLRVVGSDSCWQLEAIKMESFGLEYIFTHNSGSLHQYQCIPFRVTLHSLLEHLLHSLQKQVLHSFHHFVLEHW